MRRQFDRTINFGGLDWPRGSYEIQAERFRNEKVELSVAVVAVVTDQQSVFELIQIFCGVDLFLG